MENEQQAMLERVKEWRQKLDEASEKWGRVEICAVSKYVDAQKVNLLWGSEIVKLGENRVQELQKKHSLFNPGFQLHQIGQLQTNKVKYIVPIVSMVESLDRVALADELQRQCAKHDKVMPVLIQVNIGREPQKAGILEEDLDEFVQYCANCPNLSVQGLMAMAPLVSEPEEVRPLFKRMRDLFDGLREKAPNRVEMNCLSTGMTGDCLVAAQEGSTMVRIGTGIFGAR